MDTSKCNCFRWDRDRDMALTIAKGNILDTLAQGFVVTTNRHGVAGAGLAKAAKDRFPSWFVDYHAACKMSLAHPGGIIPFWEIYAKVWIVAANTKDNWRDPSTMEWVSACMDEICTFVDTMSLESFALVPLGAGLGGLDSDAVVEMITQKTDAFRDVNWQLYGYK